MFAEKKQGENERFGGFRGKSGFHQLAEEHHVLSANDVEAEALVRVKVP